LDRARQSKSLTEGVSRAGGVALQVRLFLAFREQTARKLGLEPQQYQMLLAIKGAALDTEVTVGSLAERMLCVPHRRRNARSPGEHGLVVRSRHKTDRRKMLVKLSVKG